jgi:hypothetical protein
VVVLLLLLLLLLLLHRRRRRLSLRARASWAVAKRGGLAATSF